MKEDILEQLVEDWLVSEPSWFVKHNIKFRPSPGCEGYISKQDSVHSDIDILAISGTQQGVNRVKICTCKSWQTGFDLRHWQNALEGEANYNKRSDAFQAREAWKSFRELVSPKWIVAFVDKVEAETGQRDFEYCIAVTKAKGDAKARTSLEDSEIIRTRFREHADSEIRLRVVQLETIVQSLLMRQATKQTTVLECTDVGRLLQLLKAAGIELSVGSRENSLAVE